MSEVPIDESCREVPKIENLEEARDKLIDFLPQGSHRFLALKKICDKFNISPSLIPRLQEDEQIRIIMKAKIIESFREFNFNCKEVYEKFKFSDPEKNEILKIGIIASLEKASLHFDLYSFREFCEDFSVPVFLFQDLEIQIAAALTTIQMFKKQKVLEANFIYEKCNISDLTFNNQEVKNIAKTAIIEEIKGLNINGVVNILEKVRFSRSEVCEFILEAIQHFLFLSPGFGYSDWCMFIERINDAFQLSTSEIRFLAVPAVLDRLMFGETIKAQEICEKYQISKTEFLDSRFQENIKLIMKKFLQSDKFPHAFDFFTNYLTSDIFNDPEIQSAVKDETKVILRRGDVREIGKLFECFLSPFLISEIFNDLETQSITLEWLKRGDRNSVILFFKDVIPELNDDLKHKPLVLEVARILLREEDLYDAQEIIKNKIQKKEEDWQFFFEDPNIPPNIRYEKTAYAEGVSPVARRARLTHCLAPDEYRDIEKKNPNFFVIKDGRGLDWENIVLGLEERMRAESEDENIIFSFKEIAKIFGARNTLRYLNRPSMTRHDGLFFAPQLISLYENSGLTSEAFSENILLQVAKDDAGYSEGSAHHHLATVVQSLSKNSPQNILQAAKQYSNIQKLQDLVKDFSGGGVREDFASWKNLKKLYEINELVQRGEILEKLNNGSVKPDLRKFVEATAFHPGVDGQSVIQFMEDPAEFLDVNDEHDSLNVHNDKKPSNYISLPYLGLTAENLRDAYVEGKIDHLQTLPPMERTYTLRNDGVTLEKGEIFTPNELAKNLRLALGSRREQVAGLAENVNKLFGEVRKFCSQYSVNLQDLVSIEKGELILAGISSEARLNLVSIIFRGEGNNYGMTRPNIPLETYRIRIGAKSDPEMVVAGNDTACCMPFGSGKNNVYMFNPNCVQLIVERKINDGWRTAAQSVVSLDLDTKKPTPDILNAYIGKQSRLRDLLTSEVFLSRPIITCDNIEIAKNEEGQRSAAILECYRRFFKDYVQTHAEAKNLDKSQVAVGKGYTKLSGLYKVKNTLIPLAPMGYSDNIHEDRFEIKTGLSETEIIKPKSGVTFMEAVDVLAVSWLEGKAYANNESLLYNIHHMQNNIIGEAIANQFFDRPNLSFVSRDSKGIPVGYILAYEGRSEDMPMIFVSDVAVDPEVQGSGAGGELMRRFLQEFAANYGTKEKPFIPVFANLRESTSYQILSKGLTKLADSVGLKAEMVEIGEKDQGGEKFHDVFLLFGRNKEEIKRQKINLSDLAAE